MLTAVAVIILIIMAYLWVAARLSIKFEAICAATCNNCSKGQVYYYNNSDREPGTGHEGDGIARALFWPVTAPFILTRAKHDPRVKRGMEAIDRYWDEKQAREFQIRTQSLEKELGYH